MPETENVNKYKKSKSPFQGNVITDTKSFIGSSSACRKVSDRT